MTTDKFRFEDRAPSPQEFSRLRADCGWGEIDLEAAAQALRGSLFDVICVQGTELVGMGRLVGDGVLYFYLQDVVVKPGHRGRSIGRRIVAKLTEEAVRRATPGATIGLMSARGKEALYAQFGFAERPTSSLGAGMTRFVL